MRIFCFLGVCLAALACVIPALADDVTLNNGVNVSFGNVGSGSFYSEIHNDVDAGYGYKGWATLYVVNESNTAWSDMHFSLFQIDDVPFGAIFVTDGAYAPVYKLNGITKTLSSVEVNNAAVGGPTLDLVFNDLIGVNQMAMFKAYTNNMATQTRFGLSVYPTADFIPEPSSILALATSLIGFTGLVIRRRK